MKRLWTLLLLALMFGFPQMKGQNLQKGKKYTAWVYAQNRKRLAHGALTHLKDSSIVIAPYYPEQSYNSIAEIEVSVENIQIIKIRRKGAVGTSIAIGALVGFATGALVGLVSSNDCDFFCPTPAISALSGGVVLMIPAAIVGGISAPKKTRTPINRNLQTYRDKKQDLKKYLTK